MSDAIDAAVLRGEEAAPKRSKWKPVGVENRGWLVARIEDTTNGNVEGIYAQQGTWYFYGVGQLSDGSYTSHTPNAELRRIARAMLQPPTDEEYDTLLRSAAPARGGDGPARRVRRKARQ